MASSLGPDGGFGHVMMIFIGVGFPCMGFPGYILCLYVVACDNIYFSLIIMLMLLAFNLTLPWSDVRAEPFCHGERIGSFHVRCEC